MVEKSNKFEVDENVVQALAAHIRQLAKEGNVEELRKYLPSPKEIVELLEKYTRTTEQKAAFLAKVDEVHQVDESKG